jgi:hypothetical protein
MPGWLAIATRPRVVRRALKYALVVGAVLIAINHGDAILHGEVTTDRWLRMGLTVVVPYVVSTLSSVEALRGIERNEQ